MTKIIGIDLGTGSIGLSVRDTDKGVNIQEQLDFFSSYIFKTGSGKDDRGYTVKSYAAERTKYRSSRRLYQSRKYRIWTTLKVLIDYGFCPLSNEDLEKWSIYNKAKGLKRKYPIDAHKFEQWVRLDFDGDGKPDYTSPYQLRAELMDKQFDFSEQIDRYKLGRALYHIAQRRGFKSSKGETLKSQEENELVDNVDVEITAELKKSEEKKSKDLKTYMNEHNLETVGCAFAHLENNNIRVRNSEYQAVRTQYEEEIKAIFTFQNELDINSEFYNRIISKKKGEGTIFYKRPLRSQKGLVGKCTLEPNKSRCPISHPDFEEFRALSFINNIKYRKNSTDEWNTLDDDLRQELFENKFLRTTPSFKFEEIIKWLEKKVQYPLSYQNKTINYKGKTNVSGCPISARLRNFIGENWKSYVFETEKFRENKKSNSKHKITYDYNDIWHICFSYDEAEDVILFAKQNLSLDNEKDEEMARIWGDIPQGYSMLSLKAIKNINRFLNKGLIYTDAVLLAKLPEIIGKDIWEQDEMNFILSIETIVEQNREVKKLLNIANSLIANYKSLEIDEQFANRNASYTLDTADIEQIEQYTKESYGDKTWNEMVDDEKDIILEKIKELLQGFFSSSNRDYYKLPRLGDAIKLHISNKYSFLHCSNNFIDKNTNLPCECTSCKQLNKLYHPSQIEFYKPSKETRFEYNGVSLSKKLLGSPVIGAFKNPMALKVLHILRRQINNLIKDGIIEEDTRVVVETARDLNDANMRWAIETYQREREKENKEFEEAIIRHYPERKYTKDDIDKARLLLDQIDIPEKINKSDQTQQVKKKKIEKIDIYKKDVTKYRLWLEQGCRCIYTGKLINISMLFDDTKVDFEHTIPRSLSFDNSLANLTVCDANFNRTIKKNKIPALLSNYEDILARIQPWIEKIEQLKDNVEYYVSKSKQAQTKPLKDFAIRQRHLWQMELDYWKNKVERFTMQEVTLGFRNSQLVDTRIISKYAYHYLKSVFNNVDVQKGSITSDFRKMLGIQSMDEKKNRDKHSHHAIDATVLTMIPVASKRDRMLKLYYEKEEAKKLNHDYSEIYKQLQKEIISCQFGNLNGLTEYIENNILVNHISKDQALSPANKTLRRRGKVVPIKDKTENVIYETNDDGTVKYRTHKDGTPIYKRDKNGNFILKNGEKIIIPIPKAVRLRGDSIRGKLHGETFYGAITQAKKDESGSLIRDKEGKIQINDEIIYVVRRELKHRKNAQDSGFYNWDDLEKVIIDKALFQIMKGQFDENTSFKDACEVGVYMLDKYGNKVNKIRHVRCCATQIKNPLVIKKQTYLSKKPYKQNYYADMGELYVMCKYQSEDLIEKEFVIYSLFDISQNRNNGVEDIPNLILGKRKDLILKQILKVGDMMLIYNERPEELQEMENQDLMKRLYVIRGFENDGKRIIIRQHINAQQEKELGKGETIKDFTAMPPKIRCSINTLKYLLINYDFKIQTNKVTFE